jgi:hypothetical protein
MRKHSTDLQDVYCQHIINIQNFYWGKDAVVKTVTDNVTINVGNGGNNIADITDGNRGSGRNTEDVEYF